MTDYDWSWENSITRNNKYINPDELCEHKYNAFRTNKALTNHLDTVYQANQVNINYFLDKKLQYDFLFNSVRKYKRPFVKNARVTQPPEFSYVQEYYGYNDKKTYEALTILSKEQLEIIRKKMNKGGAN